MLTKLLRSPKLQQVEELLGRNESLLIEGLWNAPKALIASLAQQATSKHILILTGGSTEESRLYDDFAFFSNAPLVEFPAWETMPSEQIAPSPDIIGERYKTLQKIIVSQQPHIILTSLQACLQKLIPPSSFSELFLSLKVGESYPFAKLLEQLVKMGYQRRPIAADKGEFAVRGGIIDLFPVSSPDPYRLEFWGDQIESMRLYDPVGQKSVTLAQAVEITPAQEMELIDKATELVSLLDYLGPKTLLVFDDLLSLEDRYASLVSLSGSFGRSFSTIEDFLNQTSKHQKIFWTEQPIEELSEIKILEKTKSSFYSDQGPPIALSFSMFNRELEAKRWRHSFVSIPEFLLPENQLQEATGADILEALPSLADREVELTMLCATEAEEGILQKKIIDLKLTKEPTYQLGYLSSGFVLQDSLMMILPYTEITHRFKIRRQKMRSTYHTTPSEFQDLTIGEPVVHFNNGIGRYLGIEKRPNHLGVTSEFFLIEYADNGKLFVPINQANLISKYIGAGEVSPKLHTIGSNRWKKTRETTERAILGYAHELLEMHAERTLRGGYAFPEDSDDVWLFEEEFPFVETEDQLTAVQSIKSDMQSAKSMDRLICGDVGYGKTEVAMRAAFKAVIDGQKQVAVLVPTTVLAMQHYENFLDRMSNFPINIGVLSRFRSAKETRDTIERVANGSVDILIGTHRIISEDIKFKDLGLVIIDEEQRFGVRAKEHLKKIKSGVDCLTLSATPIPRTLYMSMIGARDLSVINTPPQDRLPIKTIITEGEDLLVKNALMRELNRDGQAYFIHNRVETIYEVADRLKKLLPQARVVVGHGQMHADEMDQVFHAFKSGQADILVATTIVENGIDIPNANTILIDRSDHFGLADLYQLRGRVGRWNRKAYAYFLVKKLHVLPELSRKRLQALAEASGFGGGMKVAMRDLEIRGAGDILGTEQSGHVSAIGFHLYCKMLKRTIATLQGKIPRSMTDTKMEFPFDARLPESYIDETSLRLEFYQRFGEAFSFEEVDSLWEEVRDRFGEPPEAAQWLYYLTRLRIFASLNNFTLLRFEKVSFTAEQHKGKVPVERKFLLAAPKKPDELESRVVKTLKANFPCKD